MSGSVLVMAKAPVPGRAKTRLAGVAGPQGAAELAAAALLDTLAAGAEAFPTGHRVLALDGDLNDGCRSAAIRRALRGWVVVPQGGATFGERLVDGHRQAHRRARGPVVQIGMDTPQVSAALLRDVAELAHRHGGPVLGPAVDGGWWVLATTHAGQADVLEGVPMSRPDTGRLTAAALAAAGHRAAVAVALRDVDLPQDAEVVAAMAPQTRFATTWRAVTADALDGAPVVATVTVSP
ncbi:DUF2064 domain-containing protein [Oryzobacter telluris]|uniref:TIGR04282 family arsenosugar biosynthesis glycosyltransferase n=1 Tax=Oryzobacter telluris TaxID=3149179 RepID=UPI00370D7AEA